MYVCMYIYIYIYTYEQNHAIYLYTHARAPATSESARKDPTEQLFILSRYRFLFYNKQQTTEQSVTQPGDYPRASQGPPCPPAAGPSMVRLGRSEINIIIISSSPTITIIIIIISGTIINSFIIRHEMNAWEGGSSSAGPRLAPNYSISNSGPFSTHSRAGEVGAMH